jgi:hypothetical protein
MNIEELRRALRDDPFRPFRLRMRSGEVFDVPEIGRMALSAGGTHATVYLEDSIRFLDPREAVAMEPMEG